MRVCVCVLSVLLGLWPTAPPAAGPHPPAAAREHFITYTQQVLKQRGEGGYIILCGRHTGEGSSSPAGDMCGA